MTTQALEPEHWVADLEHTLLEEREPSHRDVPAHLLGRATVARLLRFAATDWAIIAAIWIAMSFTPAWLYPFWVVLLAGRFHAFGVILHDATHMPLRKKDWRTRLLETLCGYPIATTLNAMRYHHLRHHRDSGMKTDPYFKPSLRGRPVIFMLIWIRHLILVPFWTIRGPYGLLCVAFPKLRNSYGRAFLQDRSGQDLTESRELLTCAREELGQVLFQLAIAGLAVYRFELVLYYYLIPAAVTGLFAGYRVLMEHDYVRVSDRKLSTIIATTTDHNLGPFGRAFFAPRNIGYHIVHHLHPQTALENLPALRLWYKERHPGIYPEPYGARRRA